MNYTYTKDGAPLKLVMPPEPGAYVFRYVMNQDATILASVEVAISDVTAEITAPQTSEPGRVARRRMDRPGLRPRLHRHRRAGPPGSSYLSYVYANEGGPLRIDAPEKPGDYEIRYIMNQGGRVLAPSPLKVGG